MVPRCEPGAMFADLKYDFCPFATKWTLSAISGLSGAHRGRCCILKRPPSTASAPGNMRLSRFLTDYQILSDAPPDEFSCRRRVLRCRSRQGSAWLRRQPRGRRKRLTISRRQLPRARRDWATCALFHRLRLRPRWLDEWYRRPNASAHHGAFTADPLCSQ